MGRFGLSREDDDDDDEEETECHFQKQRRCLEDDDDGCERHNGDLDDDLDDDDDDNNNSRDDENDMQWELIDDSPDGDSSFRNNNTGGCGVVGGGILGPFRNALSLSSFGVIKGGNKDCSSGETTTATATATATATDSLVPYNDDHEDCRRRRHRVANDDDDNDKYAGSDDDNDENDEQHHGRHRNDDEEYRDLSRGTTTTAAAVSHGGGGGGVAPPNIFIVSPDPDVLSSILSSRFRRHGDPFEGEDDDDDDDYNEDDPDDHGVVVSTTANTAMTTRHRCNSNKSRRRSRWLFSSSTVGLAVLGAALALLIPRLAPPGPPPRSPRRRPFPARPRGGNDNKSVMDDPHGRNRNDRNHDEGDPFTAATEASSSRDGNDNGDDNENNNNGGWDEYLTHHAWELGRSFTALFWTTPIHLGRWWVTCSLDVADQLFMYYQDRYSWSVCPMEETTMSMKLDDDDVDDGHDYREEEEKDLVVAAVLNRHVVGQPRAVEAVATALHDWRSSWSSRDSSSSSSPLLIFLTGYEGSGKTTLAHAAAKHVLFRNCPLYRNSSSNNNNDNNNMKYFDPTLTIRGEDYAVKDNERNDMLWRREEDDEEGRRPSSAIRSLQSQLYHVLFRHTARRMYGNNSGGGSVIVMEDVDRMAPAVLSWLVRELTAGEGDDDAAAARTPGSGSSSTSTSLRAVCRTSVFFFTSSTVGVKSIARGLRSHNGKLDQVPRPTLDLDLRHEITSAQRCRRSSSTTADDDSAGNNGGWTTTKADDGIGTLFHAVAPFGPMTERELSELLRLRVRRLSLEHATELWYNLTITDSLTSALLSPEQVEYIEWNIVKKKKIQPAAEDEGDEEQKIPLQLKEAQEAEAVEIPPPVATVKATTTTTTTTATPLFSPSFWFSLSAGKTTTTTKTAPPPPPPVPPATTTTTTTTKAMTTKTTTTPLLVYSSTGGKVLGEAVGGGGGGSSSSTGIGGGSTIWSRLQAQVYRRFANAPEPDLVAVLDLAAEDKEEEEGGTRGGGGGGTSRDGVLKWCKPSSQRQLDKDGHYHYNYDPTDCRHVSRFAIR